MAVSSEVLAYAYNMFAYPKGYFENHTAKELGITEKDRQELIKLQGGRTDSAPSSKYREAFQALGKAERFFLQKEFGINVARATDDELEKVYNALREDGGPGSGNWGHKGRPGEVGGSAAGSGGKVNRITTKSGSYTSAAKVKTALARPHKLTEDQLRSLPSGCVITNNKNGDLLRVKEDGFLYVTQNGVEKKCMAGMEKWFYKSALEADSVTVAVPDLSVIDAAKLSGSDYKSIILDEGTPTSQLESLFTGSNGRYTAKSYDKEYREQSGKVWNSLNKSAKEALYYYTGSDYIEINKLCIDGKVAENQSFYASEADSITAAINKSELHSDTILYRGVGSKSTELLFGMDGGSLTPETVGDLVGRTGTQDSFSSCGSAKGTGVTDDDVSIEIYAPAGTKALYVEPFSGCGSGDELAWNGKSTQKYFSQEDETIIQRGTTYKVVSATYDSEAKTKNGKGQYKLQVIITGQDTSTAKYKKKSKKS